MERPEVPSHRPAHSNPLLSSAITGVCLQDLTHNAVLLPALAADSIAVPPQNASPVNTESSSIDAQPKEQNSNPSHSRFSHDRNENKTGSKFSKPPNNTESKESAKSKDDFDVNEYFARLQGTRYVSAPINSIIKEDQNANLEDAEESLEEINLQEDNPSPIETQQSFTADIAQNFSQLPQRLPQVASAVFNSFSNILNLNKGREVTPDYNKSFCEGDQIYCQATALSEDSKHWQYGYTQMNAPNSDNVEDNAKNVEPPKEVTMFSPDYGQVLKDEKLSAIGLPPVGDSGNTYRMASKKKTYAHIPGLSTCGVKSPPQHYATGQTAAQNLPFVPQQHQNPYGLYPTPSSIELPPPTTNVGSGSIFASHHKLGMLPPPSLNESVNKVSSAVMEEIAESQIANAVHNDLHTVSSLDLKDVSTDNNTAVEVKEQNVELHAPLESSEQLSLNVALPKPSLLLGEEKMPTAVDHENVSFHISSAHLRTSGQTFPTEQQNYTLTQHDSHTTSSSQFQSSNIVPPPPMSNSNLINQNRDPPKDLSNLAMSSFPPLGPISQRSSINRSILPPSVARKLSNPQPRKISSSEVNYFIPGDPTQETDSKSSNPIEITSYEDAVLGGSEAKSKQAAVKTANLNIVSGNVPLNPSIIQEYNIKSTSDIDSYQATSMFSSNLPNKPLTALQEAHGEPPKTLVEPPKMSTEHGKSFRLGSKRPQYYSGPIKGTAPFNNIVKPTLDPVYPTNAGRDNVALFTPSTNISATTEMNDNASLLNKNCEEVLYPRTQETIHTAFDLSRPPVQQDLSSQQYGLSSYLTSEIYSEAQRDQPKESDLLGSLKSKLGSVNINKLQSVVTTFFDPAYYETPNKDTEKSSQIQSPNPSNYSSFGKNENTINVEISVPSFDSNAQYKENNNPMHGSVPFEKNYEPYFVENYGEQSRQYSCENPQNYYGPSSQIPLMQITENQNQTDPYANTISGYGTFYANAEPNDNNNFIDASSENKQNISVKSEISQVATDICENNIMSDFQNPNSKIMNPLGSVQQADIKSTHSLENQNSVRIKEQNFISPDPVNFFESGNLAFSEESKKESKNDENIHSKEQNPENEYGISSSKKNNHVDPGDITTQMIANMTSPLQLFNPVDIPLVDSFTDLNNYDMNVDNDQLNIISQITEETIETIQIQSSNEFFENEDENDNIMNTEANVFFDEAYGNYGWSIKPEDQVLKDEQNLMDYYYGYEDKKVMGFKDDPTNIPRNASDEIKAVFQNTNQDELPPINSIIPREISIPTAPPIEDFLDTPPVGSFDSKSDVLDVNLIEQDAKKDFAALLEPYTIEPETDDSKLEKDKTDDMIEKNVIGDLDRKTSPIYENVKAIVSPLCDNVKQEVSPIYENVQKSKSPVVSFASYFDTGNYAADNHFKNTFSYVSKVDDDAGGSIVVPESNENLEIPKIIKPVSHFKKADLLNYQNKTCIDQKGNDNVKEDLNKSVDQSNIDRNVCQTLSSQPLGSNNMANVEPYEAKSTPSIPSLPQVEPSSFISQVKQELADPLHFFSSTSEDKTIQEQKVEPSYNLLASYFATPEEKAKKPDPKRSFFDLSQGQDHYMHPSQNYHVGYCEIQLTNQFRANHNKEVQCNLKENGVDNIIKDTDEYKYMISNIPHLEVDSHKIEHSLSEKFNYNNSITKQSINFENLNSNKTEIANAANEFVHNNNTGVVEQTCIDYESHLANLILNCEKCNIRTIPIFCVGVRNLETSAEELVDSDDNKNGTNSKMNLNNADSDNSKDSSGTKKGSGSPGKEGVVNFKDDDVCEDLPDSDDEHAEAGTYTPVRFHWFFTVEKDDKCFWKPFSAYDSRSLEKAFNSPDLDDNTLVATDGGRYDVHVVKREREPAYWAEKPSEVRRCSWFYKGALDTKFVPYTEDIAELLEREYRLCLETGEWHRRIPLPNGESVVLHSASVMVHFLEEPPSDSWSNAPTSLTRPRVVQRGTDPCSIEKQTPSAVDHLILLCHGIGSACDLSFRPLEDVVDDFRTTCQSLIQSHYKNSIERGRVGRVEVLPVSWHQGLHAGTQGVDARMAAITLDSIPKLRSFCNDTVMDVLLYTSPLYCQKIMDTVGQELQKIYSKFMSRNPHYKGGVSLGGHSLGSVIMFDLLCNQKGKDVFKNVKLAPGSNLPAQPMVRYPQLNFEPDALYALGSPIAIFECVRGIDSLGVDFRLPTCPKFFNIFHPYDPIAYRIEPMINPELKAVPPLLIPHHKGRKRIHLELKETMARVGADFKQRVVDSWVKAFGNMFKSAEEQKQEPDEAVFEVSEDTQSTETMEPEPSRSYTTTELNLGKLNSGHRIDRVLQEAPFELINEYFSAITSHVCYWESADVMLLILREIYSARGVEPDSKVPQQTMTVEVERAPDSKSKRIDEGVASSSRKTS